MGYLDPRLLGEVGDLGPSTYLSQLFLPCTERVQRVCVLRKRERSAYVVNLLTPQNL
jgi:hypothetical protein